MWPFSHPWPLSICHGPNASICLMFCFFNLSTRMAAVRKHNSCSTYIMVFLSSMLGVCLELKTHHHAWILFSGECFTLSFFRSFIYGLFIITFISFAHSFWSTMVCGATAHGGSILNLAGSLLAGWMNP